MTRLTLALAVLLPGLLLLAGCTDLRQTFIENPYHDYEDDPQRIPAMGLSFMMEYNGSLVGDGDDDLYWRLEVPNESSGFGRLWDSDGDSIPNAGSSLHGCWKYREDYQNNPNKTWWIRVTLYTEHPDEGGRFLNQEKWTVDCLDYWIRIGERGEMAIHEGIRPVPSNDRWVLTDVGFWVAVVVGVSLVGAVGTAAWMGRQQA